MKTIVIAAIFFLLASLSLAEEAAAPAPVSLTGEIVDMHCYTGRGQKGEEHAGCANACISRDVPAGLLTADGTLYLLLNERSSSVKEKIAGKAGKQVTAKGKVVERNGVKALQLVSVE